MRNIFLEDVETAVRQVVRCKGDHRNASSEYEDANGHHCFAAAVLIELGLPHPTQGYACNELPIDSEPVLGFLEDRAVEFEPEALAYLRSLQDAADYGTKYGEQRTWAHAVRDPYDFDFARG